MITYLSRMYPEQDKWTCDWMFCDCYTGLGWTVEPICFGLVYWVVLLAKKRTGSQYKHPQLRWLRKTLICRLCIKPFRSFIMPPSWHNYLCEMYLNLQLLVSERIYLCMELCWSSYRLLSHLELIAQFWNKYAVVAFVPLVSVTGKIVRFIRC